MTRMQQDLEESPGFLDSKFRQENVKFIQSKGLTSTQSEILSQSQNIKDNWSFLSDYVKTAEPRKPITNPENYQSKCSHILNISVCINIKIDNIY